MRSKFHTFVVLFGGFVAVPVFGGEVVGIQVSSAAPASKSGDVLELTSTFLPGEKEFSVRVSALLVGKTADGAVTQTALLSKKTSAAWVHSYSAFPVPDAKDPQAQVSVNRIALPLEDLQLESGLVRYQVESIDATGKVVATAYSTPGNLVIAAGVPFWEGLEDKQIPELKSSEPVGGGFGKADEVEVQPALQPEKVYPPRTEAEQSTVNWRFLNNPLNPLQDASHTLVYFVSNRPWRGVKNRTRPWEGMGSTYQPFEKLDTITRGAIVVRTPLDRKMGDIKSVQVEGLVGPYPESPYTAEQNQAASQFLEWIWGQDVLVFVHGYNNSFEAAAVQAAQLKADLKFPGPVVLFSWPSLAEGGGYFTDKLNAEKSLPAFADLLTHFAQGNEEDPKKYFCSPGKSFVVAHSMGNWVFLNAMGIANARKKMRVGALGKVVMAAPDVSKASFLQWGPVVVSASRNVTVYYSTEDVALALSTLIHGGKRAGQGAAVESVAGVDAINVNAVNSPFIRAGHSAFSASDKVLTDIALNFLYDIPVWKRSPPLVPNHASPEYYSSWRF